jgi:hypothetical protein
MATKIDKPQPVKVRVGEINQPPSSSRLWYPAIDQLQYIRNNYVKDFFRYSAPGANSDSGGYQGANWPNPRVDHTCSCQYYVILHSPPKEDTANAEVQLGGVIVPWAYEGDNGPTSHTNPASVLWHSPDRIQSAGLYTWATDSDKDTNTGLIWSNSNNYPVQVDPSSDIPLASALDGYSDMSKNIHLFDGRDPVKDDFKTFRWTPESDGGFAMGILETRQIMVASICLFECPDQLVYNTREQDIVRRADMSPGAFIRGWESGVNNSYGDLVHAIGNGDTLGAGIQDSAVNSALHCLFQSGGPTAWETSATSYANIRNGETSYIRVSAPNLTNSDGTIEAYPAVVVSGADLNASTKGYLKMTSLSTSDTWELEVELDNPKLYHTTDGSQASITIDLDSTPTDNYDDIKIEAKVDNGADELFIHTLSLWCADPFTYTS